MGSTRARRVLTGAAELDWTRPSAAGLWCARKTSACSAGLGCARLGSSRSWHGPRAPVRPRRTQWSKRVRRGTARVVPRSARDMCEPVADSEVACGADLRGVASRRGGAGVSGGPGTGWRSMIVVEAPGWLGATREHTDWYVTEEQRRQPGCLGRERGRLPVPGSQGRGGTRKPNAAQRSADFQGVPTGRASASVPAATPAPPRRIDHAPLPPPRNAV
jgi:hypothetical protein